MKQKTLFLCSDCGYESPKWFGEEKDRNGVYEIKKN